MGRPYTDNRLVPPKILWTLCGRGAWLDMPGRFGPKSTPYQRFHESHDDRRFDRILERLHNHCTGVLGD
jgi:transposase